ncbi:hypothetical protein [Edaphobacter albus]|nr:hypothetical protein [Edaphobacter sp. 4G125]QNI36323.1 hypothetical protein H7846_15290 [Edaphobacter sp. 4G125]
MDHHPFAGPGGKVYIEIEPCIDHERGIVTQNHPNITFILSDRTRAASP